MFIMMVEYVFIWRFGIEQSSGSSGSSGGGGGSSSCFVFYFYVYQYLFIFFWIQDVFQQRFSVFYNIGMKGIIIVVEFSMFMVLRFIFIFLFVCLVVIFLFVIYCLLGGIFDGVYFIFMEFVLLFKEVFWVVWLEWF